MKRYVQLIVLACWILFLLGAGVRSLWTGDSRFGWNMFHEQVNYQVVYSITTPTGSAELTFDDDELRGKTASKLAPRQEHQSRYGRGTTKRRIKSFLHEVSREKNHMHQQLFAEVRYSINEQDIQYTTLISPSHE